MAHPGRARAALAAALAGACRVPVAQAPRAPVVAPHPAPQPAPLRPLGPAAVLWQQPYDAGPGGHAWLSLAAGVLVAASFGRSVAFDAATGRPLYTLYDRDDARPAMLYRGHVVALGGLLFGTRPGTLVALEPGTGRTAFELPLRQGPTPSSVAGVALGPDLALIAATGDPLATTATYELLAVELPGGRLRWRHPASAAGYVALAVSEGRLFEHGQLTLVARDPGDARVLWRYPTVTPAATPDNLLTDLAFGAGVVSFVRGLRETVLLDAATGTVVATAGARPVTATLRRDGVGYTLRGPGRGAPTDLVATELSTNRELWRQSVPRYATGAAHRLDLLAVDDASVYALDGLAQLRQVDRATGSLQRAWDLGSVQQIGVLVAPDAVGPRRIFASVGGRSLVALGEGSGVPLPAEIRVAGTVRWSGPPSSHTGPVQVRVGDAVTTTDAALRYAAVASTRGVLELAVDTGSLADTGRLECIRAHPVYVIPDGSTAVRTVDLEIENGDPCPRD